MIITHMPGTNYFYVTEPLMPEKVKKMLELNWIRPGKEVCFSDNGVPGGWLLFTLCASVGWIRFFSGQDEKPQYHK